MTRALFIFPVLILLFPMSARSDGGGVGLSGRIKILTEDAFREHVVDRRAEARNGDWFLARKNGRLTGSIDRTKLNARWTWQGQNWCRKGTLGSLKISACYKLDLEDDRLRVKPAKGGNTMTYRLRF